MDKAYKRQIAKQIAKNPDLKVLEKELKKVRKIEKKYKDLSYSQMLDVINLCKERIVETIYDNNNLDQEEQYKRNSSVLNKLLPDVYALVSVAFKKSKGIDISDTQIMTAISLHYGTMVELGTGEGKTYSGAFPSILNALTGKGVHVVTSNDYLAKRDFEDLKPIFDIFGLTSSYIPPKGSSESSNEENIREKRKGYNCDICFASNSTFAFDYLFDSISKSSDDIVQRRKAPFFALIDEVDDTLFDSAQVPYIISSPAKVYRKSLGSNGKYRNMSARELSLLLDVDLDDMLKRSNLLTYFDENISSNTLLSYDEACLISGRLYMQELVSDDIPIQQKVENFISNNLEKKAYVCSDQNQFGWTSHKLFMHLSDNPYNQRGISSWEMNELIKIRDTFPIVLGVDEANNPTYALTSDGVIRKEEYFFYDYLIEQPNLIDDIKDSIVYNPYLINGRDFFENSDGKVEINYERVLFVAQKVPELKQIQEKYLVSNEYSYVSSLVDLGLRAHFELEKDKDYIIEDSNPGKKLPEVKLIINGRAEDGRSYSDGLQEAIELKEKKRLATRFFKITGQNKTSASVSQKAYYSRYSKKAGMTGTTPHEGYVSQLYDGMYVVKMPRTAIYNYVKSRFTGKNVPIPTKKEDEQFTFDNNEKYELILKSIAKSRNRIPQQPVLITTTSLADSEELAKYIKANGRKYGINKFSLLNASTDPKKEALIIAQAGKPGAITISTEMAGRGTDIKLGGDSDKEIEYYLDQFYEERKIKNVSSSQRIDDLALIKRGIELKRSLKSFISERDFSELLRMEAISHYNENGKKFSSFDEIKFCESLVRLSFDLDLNIDTVKEQETKRESLKGVGLKVILSGHFANKRIDQQAEGRQNRRGYDGGTVEYYSSKQDLLNIGMDPRIIDPLISLYNNATDDRHGQKNKRDAYKRLIKQIEKTQNNNDKALFEQIKQVQDLNLLSSSYRNKIRSSRLAIITGEEEIIDTKDGKPTIKNVDYDEKMKTLIDETIRFILVSNTRSNIGPSEIKMTPRQVGLFQPIGEITDKRWTDLDDRDMDGARFALEIEGTFGDLFRETGVFFDSSMLNKFSTVESMVKAISVSAYRGLEARLAKEGMKDSTELCKVLYTSIYDKSSVASLEIAKDVELQDRIYKSMQNQNFNPIMAFVNSMNGVMRGMQQDVMSFHFGKKFNAHNREIFEAVREAKIERSHNDSYLNEENRRVIQSTSKTLNINKERVTEIFAEDYFVLNKNGVVKVDESKDNYRLGGFETSITVKGGK